jgi:hypothetical protein
MPLADRVEQAAQGVPAAIHVAPVDLEAVADFAQLAPLVGREAALEKGQQAARLLLVVQRQRGREEFDERGGAGAGCRLHAVDFELHREAGTGSRAAARYGDGIRGASRRDRRW